MSLSFFIDVVRLRIYVSGVHTTFTNSLAANVANVSFNMLAGNGVGQILYNDRPPIQEAFTDPSPYQSYINQFISGLAGLTLAQAKQIKIDLINAIYPVKKSAAVSVTVSAGTYNWDASDEALAMYAMESSSAVITRLNTTNSSLTSMVSDLNVWAAHFNAQVTSDTNLNNALVSWWTAYAEPTVDNVLGIVSPAINTNYTAAATDASLTETFPSAGTPGTLSEVPLNATAAVSLTPADLQLIVNAVQTQRIAKLVTCNTKIAAVNSLSTVAAVAALDVTTGW